MTKTSGLAAAMGNDRNPTSGHLAAKSSGIPECGNGAGNGVRTRDPNLGKVVLYH